MEQRESTLRTTTGTVMQGIQIRVPAGVDFGRSSVAPHPGFETILTQPTDMLTLGVLRARLAHLSPVNHQRAHGMRGGDFTEKRTYIRNEPTDADRRGPTARAVDVAWPKRWSRRQACDHRRRSPGDRAQTGRAEGWRFVRRRVPMFEHTVRRNARTRQGQRREKSRAHVLKKSNSAG